MGSAILQHAYCYHNIVGDMGKPLPQQHMVQFCCANTDGMGKKKRFCYGNDFSKELFLKH